jgi:NAD(P)H-dependent FMN reductase
LDYTDIQNKVTTLSSSLSRGGVERSLARSVRRIFPRNFFAFLSFYHGTTLLPQYDRPNRSIVSSLSSTINNEQKYELYLLVFLLIEIE